MKKNYKIDYDKESDVLYINFFNPPVAATESKQSGNLIRRYDLELLIGVTIINFSKEAKLKFNSEKSKDASNTS